MSRRGARQIVFVCSSIIDQKLVSHTIEATTTEEAVEIFLKEYQVKAQVVHGPFYRKKQGVLDNTRSIKFTGQSKTAIYNDWLVNALILKDPENCAYLLFDKRVDDKKVPKPVGTFIVKLDDLRTP